MRDEDELEAAVEAALQELVDAEEIELASKRSPKFLARALASRLAAEPGLDLEQWLVDQVEVSELFVDNDALRARFASVLAGDAPERVNPELAAAIERDPDDDAARAVYGDWLTEQGDPRGELVTVQRALAKGRDPALVTREATLLGKHRRHFFGALADDPELARRPALTWRAGFFDTANVLGADLAELLRLQSARFLGELTVRAGTGDELARVVDRLPRTLRTFVLQRQTSFDSHVTDLAPLLARLPRLERVAVQARVVVMPATSRLRVLEIDAVQVRCAADVFAGHRALEKLALGASEFRDGDPLPGLFARPPERLTSLSLRSRGRVGPAEIEALARSPLGDQLVELSLRNCSIDDDVARMLHASRGLGKLATLHIDVFDLAPATIALLRERWPSVQLGPQRDDRYDPDEE